MISWILIVTLHITNTQRPAVMVHVESTRTEVQCHKTAPDAIRELQSKASFQGYKTIPTYQCLPPATRTASPSW